MATLVTATPALVSLMYEVGAERLQVLALLRSPPQMAAVSVDVIPPVVDEAILLTEYHS